MLSVLKHLNVIFLILNTLRRRTIITRSVTHESQENAGILNKSSADETFHTTNRISELFYREETCCVAATCNLQKWFSWKTRACPGRWRALFVRTPVDSQLVKKPTAEKSVVEWKRYKRIQKNCQAIESASGPVGKHSWEVAYRLNLYANDTLSACVSCSKFDRLHLLSKYPSDKC